MKQLGKIQNVFLFAILLALNACQSAPITKPHLKYVAMGSSFAAGPGVGIKNSSANPACGQSTSNYPHLLAQYLNLELTDVTCGGATTLDILSRSQHENLPPQIEAVTSDTEIVTITIGGNDLGLARDLAIETCPHWAALCPPFMIRAPVGAEAFELLYQNLKKIGISAKSRAPNALIVFLDYQAILPESGNCDAIAMNDQSLAKFRERQMNLADAVKRAANAAGAEYFSAYEVTKGHDGCAAVPYIAAADEIKGEGWNVPIFHTNQAGMNAIARGLESFIKSKKTKD